MNENMRFFIKYQGKDRYIATLHGKKLKSGKEYAFTEQDEIIFVQKNIWLSRFWWSFALFVVAIFMFGSEKIEEGKEELAIYTRKSFALRLKELYGDMTIYIGNNLSAIKVVGANVEVVSMQTQDCTKIVNRRINIARIMWWALLALMLAAVAAVIIVAAIS